MCVCRNARVCSSVTVCVAEEDGEGVSALRQRLLRVQVPQLAKFIVLQPEYDMMTRRGEIPRKVLSCVWNTHSCA